MPREDTNGVTDDKALTNGAQGARNGSEVGQWQPKSEVPKLEIRRKSEYRIPNQLPGRRSSPALPLHEPILSMAVPTFRGGSILPLSGLALSAIFAGLWHPDADSIHSI
jgi:hypothetical protein